MKLEYEALIDSHSLKLEWHVMIQILERSVDQNAPKLIHKTYEFNGSLDLSTLNWTCALDGILKT
jgi:hypothetical protein